MENLKFKKNISGKYTEVSIIHDIKGISSLVGNVYCISDEDADKLINKVNEMNKLINIYLLDNGMQYESLLIILEYFSIIDNIVNGFDIRSKWSVQEMVDRFVSSYDKKYKESLDFCMKMKQDALDNSNESYNKNWRNYDKSNELVKKYQFNSDLLISSDDFHINLEYLSSKVQEMLDLLQKK